MRKKIIIFILLTFILGYATKVEGKSGKLNLSKTIIYEGEVQKKEPCGFGTIKCVDPENKGQQIPKNNMLQTVVKQQADIEFSVLGIPIQGTKQNFCTRLINEGCKRVGGKEEGEYVLFTGTVLGYNAWIEVDYEGKTNLVYKVDVRIHESDVSMVDKYIKKTDAKYGSLPPYEIKERGGTNIASYTNGNNALVVSAIRNPNGTAYVNLTYYNLSNLKKKLLEDLRVIIGVPYTQYPQIVKNKTGKHLKRHHSTWFETNLLGIKADQYIDHDGKGLVTKVKYNLDLINHDNQYEYDNIYDIVEKALIAEGYKYTRGDHRSYGYFENAVTTVDVTKESSYMYVEFKTKPKQRKNGDI